MRYIDTDDFKGECRGEDDAYVDFQRRYNLDLLADDNPMLTDALEKLQLPTGKFLFTQSLNFFIYEERN